MQISEIDASPECLEELAAAFTALAHKMAAKPEKLVHTFTGEFYSSSNLSPTSVGAVVLYDSFPYRITDFRELGHEQYWLSQPSTRSASIELTFAEDHIGKTKALRVLGYWTNVRAWSLLPQRG